MRYQGKNKHIYRFVMGNSDKQCKKLIFVSNFHKSSLVVHYYPGDERVPCFGLSNSVFTLKQDSVGHLVAANR